MTPKWETVENRRDFKHKFHDFEFSSSITPLHVHVRVFWKSSIHDVGWYYRFPEKAAYGIYGPFETEWGAMNECNKKIKEDIAGLVEKFGGVE
jgi:hypothetical protein